MSSTTDSPALRRDRRNRGAPPRTRFDAFPRGAFARWMLRLGLAAPLALIALVHSLLPAPADTPNADLVASLASIDWNRGDAEWVALLYPHVSIMLAAANPFGRLGLSLMGAIAAGFLLQKVTEIIAQRAIPRSTGIILIIAFAANPLFAYFALENLPGFLALTFFGLALGHVVRFVTWGNTESGFRGGILIMLAAFSDPSGILYALIIVLASPFLRHGRAAAPGLRAANMLVIAFPALGAFATIAFLNVLFFGTPWPTSDVEAIIAGIAPGLSELVVRYSTPTGWLIAAQLASAWLVAIIVRRPRTIAVSTFVFLLLNIAFVLGVFHPAAAGVNFAMLMLLAIAIIPSARTISTNVLVGAVALGQIALAWLAAFDRPVVREWMARTVDAWSAFVG